MVCDNLSNPTRTCYAKTEGNEIVNISSIIDLQIFGMDSSNNLNVEIEKVCGFEGINVKPMNKNERKIVY